MKIYYYKAEQGNFGDDLNLWLWPKLIDQDVLSSKPGIFISIGTVLDDRFSGDEGPKIVFGAGIRDISNFHTNIDGSWDIRFVRGPITAEALKLSRDKVITDPAIALALLEWVPANKKYSCSFIPHYRTASNLDCKALAEKAGLHFIDPRQSVDKVIDEIRSSEKIITEAMHGAIVADTFRVPWLRVNVQRSVSDVADIFFMKWLDWGLSLGVDVSPAKTRPLPVRFNGKGEYILFQILKRVRLHGLADDLANVIENEQFRLSKDEAFNKAVSDIKSQIDIMNNVNS